METKIQGVVIKRHDVEIIESKKNDKTYESLTVLIQVPGTYPKQVAITFFNNVDAADALDAGVEAVFTVKIDSKEYNGRYFHNINCSDVSVVEGNVKHNEPSNTKNPYADENTYEWQDENSDLPF